MKYALEYDTADPNTLTIHFNKWLMESSALPEKDMIAGESNEYVDMAHGDNNIIVDDDTEPIFYGVIKKKTIGQWLKIMGGMIYSIEGVRGAEICDYEIILQKSLFFEWDWIVNSVIATVLIFIEPNGKATETSFNQGGKKNKKRIKKEKSKLVEISWDTLEAWE